MKRRMTVLVSEMASSLMCLLSKWMTALEYDSNWSSFLTQLLKMNLVESSFVPSLCTILLISDELTRFATRLGSFLMAALS